MKEEHGKLKHATLTTRGGMGQGENESRPEEEKKEIPVPRPGAAASTCLGDRGLPARH